MVVEEGIGAATPITYSEAVQIAKSMLEDAMHITHEGFKQPYSVADSQTWRLTQLQDLGLYMIETKDPKMLLEWAQQTADGFDAMRLGLAMVLSRKSRVKLPDDLIDWLIALLRGEVVRPEASPGRIGNKPLRNEIAFIIRCLMARGLKATRNDASGETSACDAVAEALRALDLEPKTFHGVKRIWMKSEKLERLAWQT